MPPPHSPEYFAGTQDDDYGYGAPSDALNWFAADVDFSASGRTRPSGSTSATPDRTVRLELPLRTGQPATACRSPGITDPAQYLDILSYRQRPTFRLQYRNFKTLRVARHQPVRRGGAGRRRSPLVRDPEPATDPVIYQQGTYAPGDGVHRWMGSVAQDKFGNLAAGLQRRQRDRRLPGHPLRRAPGQRPARPAARRAKASIHERDAASQTDDQLALGRLHVAERRSHATTAPSSYINEYYASRRVACRHEAMANAHRRLQVPRLPLTYTSSTLRARFAGPVGVFARIDLGMLTSK